MFNPSKLQTMKMVGQPQSVWYFIYPLLWISSPAHFLLDVKHFAYPIWTIQNHKIVTLVQMALIYEWLVL